MRDIVRRLVADFFSTIVFLAIYLASGNVLLATIVAIGGAIFQYALSRWRGVKLDRMALASVALVVILGTATLLTDDPRFVLAKPSIAHFAIGAIMLRRNWMARYVPPIVQDKAADLVLVAGYLWAALMFALGLGTIAFALNGNLRLWTIYVSVIAVGAKVLAFALQYLIFNSVIRLRIRRASGAPLSPLQADQVQP